MMYNAQYYRSSKSNSIIIDLNQKQLTINSKTPNQFQIDILYDNCFGLTYSKDELRSQDTLKSVGEYIPYLIDTPTVNEINNSKSEDYLKYTTLTLHTLDIPERDRIKSSNKYVEYTISFEDAKQTFDFYKALKEKINIKENRRILCILNPMSGRKKSLQVYNKLVVPMFKIANITPVLEETQYQCHCEEIAYNLNLDDYDGIVSVSGDGLFHELLNGILSRDDWEKARYMPIGMISSGTSNALNINFDITTSRHSILNIIKGNVIPFDIIRASQGDKVFFGHLSLSWGIMADVDIQSDRFRFIGKYKYYLAGAIRILFVNKYHGQLYYLPEDSNVKPSYEIVSDFEANKIERENKILKRLDKDINLNESKNEKSTNNSEKKSKYNKNHIGLGPKARYTNDNQITEKKLKKDWVHVDMDFTSLSAVNFPFLSFDTLFGPEANPQDGMIDLIYTDTLRVYSIMLDDAHGTYYKGKRKDDFHVKRTKAFILIPDNTKTGEGGEFGVGLTYSNGKKDLNHGILDLDGEIIPYEPIRIEILPQLQNIYAPTGMDLSYLGKTLRK
ncbi:hypothetical protein BCR36DRAFT_411605 [Piromyces finnis]|uniref:DAGKc domain-containing protein n=1 Tax=Piromyces finnis TaxID=1754191 RepID=A0A1Y1VBL9_9FUNG|nr:hypothetical protein BCR36DRAFT_411605 [Piromyces finnis]|eukprot:ORX52158.1 hypothetical protein BCR36DRAFT_411605 [Piromyces finnis]